MVSPYFVVKKGVMWMISLLAVYFILHVPLSEGKTIRRKLGRRKRKTLENRFVFDHIKIPY